MVTVASLARLCLLISLHSLILAFIFGLCNVVDTWRALRVGGGGGGKADKLEAGREEKVEVMPPSEIWGAIVRVA